MIFGGLILESDTWLNSDTSRILRVGVDLFVVPGAGVSSIQ